MAQVNFFRYLPGNSPLHRLDPRLKLPLMAAFTAAALSATAPAVVLLALLTAGLFRTARIPATLFFRELRRFALLFLLIAAAAFLSAPAGQTVPAAAALQTETAAQAGNVFHSTAAFAVLPRLSAALFVCFRFVLLIAAATLLTATTRLPDLRRAIEYFLRPLPFVDEKKTALMMELMISFFPLIFVKMDEIREASAARGGGSAQGLRRMIRNRVLPLILVTFRLADEITAALEARCYSENRTSRRFASTGLEKAAASLFFLLLLFAAFATG